MLGLQEPLVYVPSSLTIGDRLQNRLTIGVVACLVCPYIEYSTFGFLGQV